MAMTTGEILTRFRELSDELDAVKAQEKRLNAEWDELEKAIASEAERQGVPSFSMPGVRVKVEPAVRVGYDPARWGELLEWAARTGNYAMVQRRIGEKAVLDYIDSGQGTPPGVELTAYTKVSVTRN